MNIVLPAILAGSPVQATGLDNFDGYGGDASDEEEAD